MDLTYNFIPKPEIVRFALDSVIKVVDSCFPLQREFVKCV